MFHLCGFNFLCDETDVGMLFWMSMSRLIFILFIVVLLLERFRFYEPMTLQYADIFTKG
jgi:hypothetical protein